jgi:hypothetical protein
MFAKVFTAVGQQKNCEARFSLTGQTRLNRREVVSLLKSCNRAALR